MIDTLSYAAGRDGDIRVVVNPPNVFLSHQSPTTFLRKKGEKLNKGLGERGKKKKPYVREGVLGLVLLFAVVLGHRGSVRVKCGVWSSSGLVRPSGDTRGIELKRVKDDVVSFFLIYLHQGCFLLPRRESGG